MNDKFLMIIILFLISGFSLCFVHSKLVEKNNINNYSIALKEYQQEQYQDSYKHFAKVSLFSDIKTPALFRQARCATLIGDIKGAKKNYKKILAMYPNSKLYVVSEYNLAMLLYELNDKSARKYFSHILKHYPETDYALAAEYYIASIDIERASKIKNYKKRKKLRIEALNHLINYVKKSPDGRFAKASIKKIDKLGIVLTKENNLFLAESCYQTGQYEKASAYFESAPIDVAWARYAKNEFKRGNYPLFKAITENGLKYFSKTDEHQNAYDAIDEYISLVDDKNSAINDLISRYPKSQMIDYLLYLKAKISDDSLKYKLYKRIYDNYPTSDFSAESLYETFYSCVVNNQLDKAIISGQKHLEHFEESDTAPAVMYWMGKIYEKKHKKSVARSYYKGVISKYPDSYYSYRAYCKLHKNKELFIDTNIKVRPIVFPYPNSKEQKMALKLIELEDYDFITELYKDDKFVESWIAYKKGDFVKSVIIAQKAMKKLYPKPSFSDPKWRLVYPLYYFAYVNKYRGDEDPLMLMSIIREESHFNTEITSPVGASGLMQLMPATANEIAQIHSLDNNLFNPETNIRLGSLYYSKMKKSLSGVDAYAVMAYNGGWASVNRWIKTLEYNDLDELIENVPYPETKAYIKKVLKSYWCYSNIY